MLTCAMWSLPLYVQPSLPANQDGTQAAILMAPALQYLMQALRKAISLKPALVIFYVQAAGPLQLYLLLREC